MKTNTHSELGASGAHRWLRCPASVKYSRGIEVTSVYAEEGTLAHDLAESCFYFDESPLEHLGQSFNNSQHVVTEEMAHHVSNYLAYVKSISGVKQATFKHTKTKNPLCQIHHIIYRTLKRSF